MPKRILVWDFPTRVFHRLLVLNFAGVFYTADSERWRNIHVLCGYTMVGLIVFRLIWGFFGTRYARFTEFVRSPAVTILYLKQLSQKHPVGHNPTGAIAILLLLLLGFISCLSGWAIYEEIDGDELEKLHEYSAYFMLIVVLIHIAGVLVSSYLQGENLILAMITGKKQGETNQAIPNSYPLIALFLCIAVIIFWIFELK